MTSRTGIALAALALAHGAAAATTLHMKHDRWESTTVLEGNKLRVETTPAAGKPFVMIFDGDAQKLISLDLAAKTYTERTPAAMKAEMDGGRQRYKEKLAAMSPEQRKKMEDSLAKLPEAQRRQMQNMMSDSPQPLAASKWEKTGSRQQVAGYPCDGFRETREGKLVAQGCFIPWGAGAVTKSDLAALKRMAEFMKAGMGSAVMSSSVLSDVDALPGYPGEFASVDEDGTSDSKMTLTGVQHGSAPAGAFAPPAGFTRVERPAPQGRGPH